VSKLSDELNRIFEWLEDVSPNTISCYNPGLSRQQIERSIGDLEFKLPEEWYELYQFRDGFNYASLFGSTERHPAPEFLFPEQLYSSTPISFCSLEDAIDAYDSKIIADNALGSDYEYWNKKWFPIAAYETKRILYVVGDLEPSPVYLWDVDSQNPLRIYKNLTSMMSVIAECCENDLYQVIQNRYGDEGDLVICIDEEQLDLEKSIYEKYNS
jgi:cell wall assembly regulator SMI1